MSEDLASVDSAKTWLWEVRPRPARAIATLVLLPHSGAMAQGYARWAPWFSDAIHLVAVQYPGRGTRFLEEHATDISELANPLAAVLAGEPGPLFVFGHSLGGLVGFEICWRLEQMGRGPGGFFPSATPAAHYSHLLRQPSDVELVAGLLERGGMDRVALEDPELLGLVLDACRSDWVMTTTYQYSNERRLLRCPIIAFGGARDPGVPTALLNGWPDLTTGPSDVHVLDGGHFYFDGQMATLTAHLEQQIRSLVGQGEAADDGGADRNSFPELLNTLFPLSRESHDEEEPRGLGPGSPPSYLE